jgi:hypothetical protein
MKKKKPFQQGEMDCFCGPYSVINALYYLDIIETKNDALDQLLRMLSRLEQSSSLLTRMEEGTGGDELVRMLKVCGDCHHNVKRKRPFFRQAKSITIEQYRLALTQFFEWQDGVALISIEGFHDHWTIVTGVSERSFHLFDSGGLQRLSINHCNMLCALGEARTNRRTHIIDPFHTHFMWVDS